MTGGPGTHTTAPQDLLAASRYQGCAVQKNFVSPTHNKVRSYVGTVVKARLVRGEQGIVYLVKYEDGDTEDISFDELLHILLPDEMEGAAQGGAASRLPFPNLKAGNKGMEAGKRSRPSSAAPTGDTNGKTAAEAANPDLDADPEPRRRTRQRTSPNDSPAGADDDVIMDAPGPASAVGGPSLGRGHKRAAPPAVEVEAEAEVGGAGQEERAQAAGGAAGAAAAGSGAAPQANNAARRRGSAGRRGGGDDADGGGNTHQQVLMPVFDEGLSSSFSARKVGNAGHIARVRVENFMCHENFELELGTHVTLVSGTNGSGKSAVMQALQTCLGVSARSTGRGTNLPGFIRTGAVDAKVQITLWNTGGDAYRPEIFGDRITIERRITRTNSPYRLLDSRGRVVSQKRDDVYALLDAFAIDASNPLTIITQDMARQFLAAGKDDARKKYEMFMEGTLLTDIKGKLTVAKTRVDVMGGKLAAGQADVQKLAAELNDVSKRLEKLLSAATLLEQRLQLERAAAWEGVLGEEATLERARACLAEHVPALEQGLRRLEAGLVRRIEELAAREAEMIAESERCHERVANYDKEIRALKLAEMREKRALTEAQTQQHAMMQARSEAQTQKEVLCKQLAERTDNARLQEQKRLFEEHEALVHAKQQELAQANKAQDEAKAALDALLDERQQLEDRARTSERRAADGAADVSELRRQVDGLARGQANNLVLFGGDQVVQLKRAIAANLSSFRAEPIGPIGAYLKLHDAKWGLAVESAIGSALNVFLVSCAPDAALLRQLAAQARMDRTIGITICNFQQPRHSIPASRMPANGYPSVLDQLVFDNPVVERVVLNYLVDKFKIESAVLVLNAHEGRNVTYDQAAGAHIRNAYCADNGSVCKSSGRGMVWVEHFKGRQSQARLSGDVRAQLHALQEELGRAEALAEALQQEAGEAGAALQELRQRTQQAENRYRAAQAARVKAVTAVNRARQAMPQAPGASDEGEDEAGILMTQLQQVQTDYVECDAQLIKAQEEVRLAQEAVRQAEKARLEYASEAQAAIHERQRHADQLEALAKQKAETREHLNGRQGEIENLKLARTRTEDFVMTQEVMVGKALAAATKVCSRAEGEAALEYARNVMEAQVRCAIKRKAQGEATLRNMTPEQLEKAVADTLKANLTMDGMMAQLQRIAKRIAETEKEAGSNKEELEIRQRGLQRLVAQKSAMVGSVEAKMRLLQAAYERRDFMYQELQQQVEALTQNKFKMYLQRRDHTGRIKLDHAAGALQLQIKPRGRVNKDAVMVEDLKQLSGGERSYTTVSFLLAIGHSTESPFRCMDEFDVFMDAINRRVATETLLEFAYDNPSYQYIFLTPQDLQAVEDARQELMKKRRIELPSEFLKTVQMRPARGNNMHAARAAREAPAGR